MRSITLVLSILLIPFTPLASAGHQGCDPPTTPAEHQVAAGPMTLYTYVEGNHVWVYAEANGIPGLQRTGGCNHRADNTLAEACTRVETRFPGTIACVIET